MQFPIPRLPAFSPEVEARLQERHDAEMEEIIPIVGPLFGLTILAFGVWDYAIDPERAQLTVLLRAFFVMTTLIAYRKSCLPWSPTVRCVYINYMYNFAIILSEYLLHDGFLYGAVGVSSGLYILAIITLGFRTFIWGAIPPFAAYVVATASVLPRFEFINGVVFYLMSAGIAVSLLAIVRYLRRRAFYMEWELLQRASHDSLTGLFNRGQLNELGVHEMALARRHRRQLAILMLDIDHFKIVNDTFGHDIGDLALKALAKTCQDTVRQMDHVGRFGGEEFICILPETTRDEALACAERLRTHVEAMHIDTSKGIVRFTISIGVALCHEGHADWESLVRDADAAMYQAKQDGRNCVRLAYSPQAPQRYAHLSS